CFFFSSRRRHTRFSRDWSSDVCSSDLPGGADLETGAKRIRVKSKTNAKLPKANVVRGGKARVKGRVKPGSVGRKVIIKVGGKKRSEERRVGKECGAGRWATENTQ